jgi:hypothetical protein
VHELLQTVVDFLWPGNGMAAWQVVTDFIFNITDLHHAGI